MLKPMQSDMFISLSSASTGTISKLRGKAADAEPNQTFSCRLTNHLCEFSKYLNSHVETELEPLFSARSLFYIFFTRSAKHAPLVFSKPALSCAAYGPLAAARGMDDECLCCCRRWPHLLHDCAPHSFLTQFGQSWGRSIDKIWYRYGMVCRSY